jgi:hypothetical protein
MSECLFGWFDDEDQSTPAYDPPRDAACLFCGAPITADDVRTHSIMYRGSGRCYFYRTHRTCAEKDKTGMSMDGVVFDMIEKAGN